jgi:hypothetical protein
MLVLVAPPDVSSSFMTLHAVVGQAYAGTSMRRNRRRSSRCERFDDAAKLAPDPDPDPGLGRDRERCLGSRH